LKELGKKKPIIISDKIQSDKLYTTIMVDPDAPYPNKPIHKYQIHYLKINSKNIKVAYHPPNPPMDSDYHKYQIFIYEQSNFIEMEKLQYGPNFNLYNFVKKYKLKKIDGFEFFGKK
jgi:phosphatidylethanolamine-binding protein (PEBP) family uncharacterized protein